MVWAFQLWLPQANSIEFLAGFIDINENSKTFFYFNIFLKIFEIIQKSFRTIIRDIRLFVRLGFGSDRNFGHRTFLIGISISCNFSKLLKVFTDRFFSIHSTFYSSLFFSIFKTVDWYFCKITDKITRCKR